MCHLLAVCFGLVGLDFTFCRLEIGYHFKETWLWVGTVSDYRAKKWAQSLMELEDKSSTFLGGIKKKKWCAIEYPSPKKIVEIDSNGSVHMRVCVSLQGFLCASQFCWHAI